MIRYHEKIPFLAWILATVRLQKMEGEMVICIGSNVAVHKKALAVQNACSQRSISILACASLGFIPLCSAHLLSDICNIDI